MDYPQEILPNASRKRIVSDISERYVIRLVNKTSLDDIFDPEMDQISIQAICSPTEHIDDLSINLWGIYQEHHTGITLTAAGKPKYNHYCEPDEVVDTPVYQTDFSYPGSKLYWAVQVGKLHNIPFDYTRGEEQCIAVCKVCHTPMKWNFWHFSLRWETTPNLDQLQEKERKKIAKRIGHSVRVAISHFARLITPMEAQPLPIEYYEK